MSNNRFNFLIVISILWIAGIFSFYIFGLFERPSSFNELGDFLAGVFAPVAFVWLILGYIQQGKQLEQNTKALEQQERALQLQIEEMREGIKQQKNLNKMQSQQLEMDNKKVNPLFDVINFKNLYPSQNSYFAFEISWINLGAEIYDAEIFIDYIEEPILAEKRWMRDEVKIGENFSQDDLNSLADCLDMGEHKYFPIRISYVNSYREEIHDLFRLDMYFSGDKDNKQLDLVKLEKMYK